MNFEVQFLFVYLSNPLVQAWNIQKEYIYHWSLKAPKHGAHDSPNE